jgi:DNA repair exonuclease SbcCD ATPase subunit
VREEKQKLSALEERERHEQAMIDTETRKKKASLAHIAAVKQQIERLESQKEHAQHEKLERQKEAAQHAAERAHQAKKRSKTVQSLELEMAAIKKAENARLAALSAKIKLLGGKGDTSGGVAKPERAHTPKEKAAVKVLSAPRNQKLAAKPLVASSLADAAPIKEALFKLAQDEKTTDGILAPKSAAKLSTLTSRNSPSSLTQRARSSLSGVCVCVCVCVCV